MYQQSFNQLHDLIEYYRQPKTEDEKGLVHHLTVPFPKRQAKADTGIDASNDSNCNICDTELVRIEDHAARLVHSLMKDSRATNPL